MEKNVWVYWTGQKPQLIDILLNLIKQHSQNGRGYNLNLLDDAHLSEFMKIPPYFNKLNGAHKADYIRVKVVKKYGGIWLDADTLVMSDLSRLFEYIQKKDGFLILENGKHLINGVFGSKKETELMKEWEKQMEDILKKKEEKIEWNEIGSRILDAIRKKNPEYMERYQIINGLENMYRVNWKDAPKVYYSENKEWYEQMKGDELQILVGEVYKEWERREIIGEKTVLYRLIAKSSRNLEKGKKI